MWIEDRGFRVEVAAFSVECLGQGQFPAFVGLVMNSRNPKPPDLVSTLRRVQLGAGVAFY